MGETAMKPMMSELNRIMEGIMAGRISKIQARMTEERNPPEVKI